MNQWDGKMPTYTIRKALGQNKLITKDIEKYLIWKITVKLDVINIESWLRFLNGHLTSGLIS